MAESEPYGEPVPDHEDLLRQIRTKDPWLAKEGRASSALFKNPSFSSFVESMQSVDETQTLNKPNGGIVRYLTADAKRLQFDARLEPEEGNDSHVNVYQPGTGRKARARQLLECCEVVVTPAFDR